ncbi:hypothetical protein VIGAN_07121900, partial [Vigna angularis var. angularis]
MQMKGTICFPGTQESTYVCSIPAMPPLSFPLSLSHTCQFSLLFSQPPIFCTHQLSTWHGTTPSSGPYCINKQCFSLRPPSNVCTSDKKILGWSRGLGFMSQTHTHTPPNQFLVKICN